MQIKFFLTVLCTFCSTLLLANPLKDSVGVENHEGKEVILHKIAPKETYYSLSRKYNVPFKYIMAFNPSVALQAGMIVKIPTERPFTKTANKAAVPSTSSTEHTVKRKETLYSIAKMYQTTVEDLKKNNGLTDNSVKVGQVLNVGPAGRIPTVVPAPSPVAAAVPEPKPVTVAPADTSSADNDSHTRQNRYGLLEHEEKGVGVWISDENIDSSKMLALHLTAPAGTIIKVTNPMNGKSTLVKVVGKFTQSEVNKDVLVVLTKAVADVLGILDKRFQVSIVY